MQHLIVPLDPDHVHAVAALAAEVAEAAALPDLGPPACPHVTVVAFTGIEPAAARRVVESVLAGTRSFEMRAHGYGLFARSGDSGSSLNVPVVRGKALDQLHALVHDALAEGGAEMAGWTVPDTWSPHVTLTDHALDTAALGRAIAELAGRRHPSWHIPVERVLLVGGWSEPIDETDAITLVCSRKEGA